MPSCSWRGLPPFVVPLALALTAGCAAPIEVTQNFTAGTSFTPYKTFALAPPEMMEKRFGKSPIDPAVQRRIEAALVRELSARGLSQAALGQADLVVGYFAGVAQGENDRTLGYKYEWNGGISATQVPIHEQIWEGWLTVDLVDPKTGNLVWRGKGKKEKPDEQAIDAVTAAVLAQYPPAR